MAYRGGTLMVGNDKCYPNAYFAIGDLFFTTNKENPSVRFGGAWELFGKGKTLVCVDENDSDFNEVKKIGGEKTHKLTFNEMPAHAHNLNAFTNGSGSTGRFTGNYEWSSTSSDTESTRWIGDTTTAGSGQPHNNLQPYITCYIWIRVK